VLTRSICRPYDPAPGPLPAWGVRANTVRDLVVIRLKRVLMPAQRQSAKTAEEVDMVKRLRQNLIAQGRDKLCEQISEITGAKILGSSPISTRNLENVSLSSRMVVA
jgi:uncharacterized protein YbcI